MTTRSQRRWTQSLAMVAVLTAPNLVHANDRMVQALAQRGLVVAPEILAAETTV